MALEQVQQRKIHKCIHRLLFPFLSPFLFFLKLQGQIRAVKGHQIYGHTQVQSEGAPQ